MSGTVQHSPTATWVANTPPMQWSMGCDSFIMAILTAAAPLGIAVSYAMLKGLSATAFRLMFRRDWQRYAPDALQGYDHTRLAYGALGLHADTLTIDPTDADARAAMRQAICEKIDAGLPALALQLMGWEDWGVAAGYAGGGETLLCRTLHAQEDDLTPAKCWPWMIQTLTPVGPAPSRKGSMMRSLRVALEMYETESYGDYLSGRAAYQAWMDGLHEESFYAPLEQGGSGAYAERLAGLKAADAENLAADRPLSSAYLERAHVNHWRLKSLTDARRSAAQYLAETAQIFGGEAGARLAAAGRDYEEVVSLLELAKPFAPAEYNLEEQAWTQKQRDKQAALMQQAVEVEEVAIQAIRAALSRMSTKVG